MSKESQLSVAGGPLPGMERSILFSMFCDHCEMAGRLVTIQNFALAKSELRAAIQVIEQMESKGQPLISADAEKAIEA